MLCVYKGSSYNSMTVQFCTASSSAVMPDANAETTPLIVNGYVTIQNHNSSVKAALMRVSTVDHAGHALHFSSFQLSTEFKAESVK